ncbi:MAG: N-acetylneuraminate synthase family protein [Nitrososphaera sp.]
MTPPSISIGKKALKKYESVYIIAEVGSNHDNSLKRAKDLIQLAKECGADAAKFQSFTAEGLISRKGFESKSSFQSRWKKSVWDTYVAAEMPRQWHGELADYAKSQGIDFFTSPWDDEALEFLVKIRAPAIKIGSGDIDNYDLLRKAGATKKPILLGTGASTMAEVESAVAAIKSAGNDKIVLMHCVVNYPSDINQANIRALPAMESAFGLPVGYSDHAPSDLVVTSSVALGAVAIEKHFTDDRKREGPDHPHSMNPNEFADMVSKIRTLARALGDGVKVPVKDEEKTKILQRRSVFAVRPIKKGEKLTKANIRLLRPATGIAPKYLDVVLGRKAVRDIAQYEPVQWTSV